MSYSSKLQESRDSHSYKEVSVVYFPESDLCGLMVSHIGKSRIFVDKIEVNLDGSITSFDVPPESVLLKPYGELIIEGGRVSVSDKLFMDMAYAKDVRVRLSGSAGKIVLKDLDRGGLIELLSIICQFSEC